MKAHDVYSYGVVASSTLYSIRGALPEPEGYAEIDDVRHMTGGEATNSSIVLSRLGADVMLDGNCLGANDGGKRIKALLSEYRIDTSRLPLIEGYEGVQEVVFAAAGTRTIFGTYCRLRKTHNGTCLRKKILQRRKSSALTRFLAKLQRELRKSPVMRTFP